MSITNKTLAIAIIASLTLGCASQRVARQQRQPQGNMSALYEEPTGEQYVSQIQPLSNTTSQPVTSQPVPGGAIPPGRIPANYAHQLLQPGDNSAVTTVSHEVAVGSAAAMTPALAAVIPASAIESCPPCPRCQSVGPTPCAPGMVGNTPVGLSPDEYQDEYICDGGDRGWPVHYNVAMRLGLDTEDTIAEYVDHTGKETTRTSNKVCVYAPRFSAVRVVTASSQDETARDFAGMEHHLSGAGIRSRQNLLQNNKESSLHSVHIRSRSGGLETETRQLGLRQHSMWTEHQKLQNLYQNLTFLTTGNYDQNEKLRIEEGMRSAGAWNRRAYPIMSAQMTAPVEGVRELHSATITHIDDKPSDKKGELRLVKLADKQAAVIGEEITFTIRYDNQGRNDVSRVRIVDNLTTRLEYVAESSTSDRDAQFTTEDNGQGSLILIWELNEPLPAGSGGVVSFRAKVK